MSKLSIITICYNEPDLEKTCESIVNQTWQDFEWIVIDGGSNQQTLDIFEKYKDRINVYVSEPDTGRYNAFNKGLEYVNGEYVHFLNAGDYYYNENVLRDVFDSNFPNADIVHGDLYFKNTTNPEKDTIRSSNHKNICPTFFINKIVYHPATFIKSTLFTVDDGFRFNENYKIVGDLEMWIVFAKQHAKFCHINKTISVFNMNGISENEKYRELHKKERTEVINKYFTSEEIELAKKEYKNFSMWEQIFSITNTRNRKHKVLTILGIHIKIRKK